MSYDFDDQPHALPERTALGRIASVYWRFVLWAALDAKSPRLNRWGYRRLTRRS